MTVNLDKIIKEVNSSSEAEDLQSKNTDSSYITKIAEVFGQYAKKQQNEVLVKVAELFVEATKTAALVEKRDLVDEIISGMIKQGSLEVTKLDETTKQLMQKSDEDLKIHIKALELVSDGSVKLGTICMEETNNINNGFSDPFTAMRTIIDYLN